MRSVCQARPVTITSKRPCPSAGNSLAEGVATAPKPRADLPRIEIQHPEIPGPGVETRGKMETNRAQPDLADARGVFRPWA
jgi:hypothetical protein